MPKRPGQAILGWQAQNRHRTQKVRRRSCSNGRMECVLWAPLCPARLAACNATPSALTAPPSSPRPHLRLDPSDRPCVPRWVGRWSHRKRAGVAGRRSPLVGKFNTDRFFSAHPHSSEGEIQRVKQNSRCRLDSKCSCGPTPEACYMGRSAPLQGGGRYGMARTTHRRGANAAEPVAPRPWAPDERSKPASVQLLNGSACPAGRSSGPGPGRDVQTKRHAPLDWKFSTCLSAPLRELHLFMLGPAARSASRVVDRICRSIGATRPLQVGNLLPDPSDHASSLFAHRSQQPSPRRSRSSNPAQILVPREVLGRHACCKTVHDKLLSC